MAPKDEFPVHWAVWENDRDALMQLISGLPQEKIIREQIMEKLDPRGRTPLLLAVTMGHIECAQILLKNGANATAESKQYWSVDEAVTSGDPDMVSLCVKYRDFQRFERRRHAVANLLDKLRQTTDFYVEMKWEFHSWIPFVSKVCPSDTYRIYKRGPDVRIDTTLLGFDNGEWKRGRQTFIFRAKRPHGAEFIVIDHDVQVVFIEDIPDYDAASSHDNQGLDTFTPTEEAVVTRLTSPVAETYVDVEKITFERKQTGILGFKSEKTENVNGYESKVFSASNVELVTKVRTEHLLDEDKKALENQHRNMLENLMSWFQGSEVKSNGLIGGGNVAPDEYFNSFVSLEGKDVGRPKEISAKSRKFNATLWLANDFPLSLSEQVLPIVDLMATTNAHFARLRNFITLQLPAGFPVKIEIPLFHLITASVTFENTHSETNPVVGVTPILDAIPKCCMVDDSIFDIPSGYSTREMTSQQHNWTENEEDALLQFAIQQSVSHNPSSRREIPIYFSEEEIALQRAIDESLRGAASSGDSSVPTVYPVVLDTADVTDEFDLALAESLREEEERRQRIQREEEELAKILELSLQDK